MGVGQVPCESSSGLRQSDSIEVPLPAEALAAVIGAACTLPRVRAPRHPPCFRVVCVRFAFFPPPPSAATTPAVFGAADGPAGGAGGAVASNPASCGGVRMRRWHRNGSIGGIVLSLALFLNLQLIYAKFTIVTPCPMCDPHASPTPRRPTPWRWFGADRGRRWRCVCHGQIPACALLRYA